MNQAPSLLLGAAVPVDNPRAPSQTLRLPAHHLITHGVVVGMTGSGKTGLVSVMIEEALRAQVPVLVIDVKGDLPNLLLSFPSFDPRLLLPWVEALTSPGDPRTAEERAIALMRERQAALASWDISEATLRAYHAASDVRVL